MASFKESFAAARKAGKKEFTWNGKKYNTKLKGGSSTKKKASTGGGKASKPATKGGRTASSAPKSASRPKARSKTAPARTSAPPKRGTMKKGTKKPHVSKRIGTAVKKFFSKKPAGSSSRRKGRK